MMNMDRLLCTASSLLTVVRAEHGRERVRIDFVIDWFIRYHWYIV